MSVIMKRSCNSNVTVKEDSITFNSFVLKIDGLRFEEFKTIANYVNFEPDRPDRNVRILEHILELALVHYAREMTAEGNEEEEEE